MPEGIKLLLLECFESKHDGESIEKFTAALELYFYLIGLKNDNIRALFTKICLTKEGHGMMHKDIQMLLLVGHSSL